VSCYVKRRQPPDLFPDDLNFLLNICDYSVTVVGDERLPSSSINRALASLASSHISLPLVAYYTLFSSLLLHHGQEQERWKFVAPFRRQAEARADPSLEGLRRFRVLGGGVSSESEGSPVYTSPPASSDDSDDSQGIAAEVWTYIRAVERSELEGSNESEVSSDEENSSDSSEEGSGGDGNDEGDSDDGGDGDADGDDSEGDDGEGDSKGDGKGSSGSSKASGKAPLA
jgi:hypothetical protein